MQKILCSTLILSLEANSMFFLLMYVAPNTACISTRTPKSRNLKKKSSSSTLKEIPIKPESEPKGSTVQRMII